MQTRSFEAVDGDEVLYLQATAYPGERRLQVTGPLGDVMKESASAGIPFRNYTGQRLNEGNVARFDGSSVRRFCTCYRL